MPEAEPRLPCPVCLGVKMEKSAVGSDGELVLDHCSRCGGVWFDAGEVRQLREFQPDALGVRLAASDELQRMQCHDCRTMMDRKAEACPGCGRENVLECPFCGEAMKRGEREGHVLDACPRCRGVWFDHNEIAAIWNPELDARQAADRLRMADGPGYYFVDALATDPFIVAEGAEAVVRGASAAPESLAHAPELADGIAEAGGAAAEAVFEVVVEILGSAVSGL